MSTKARKKNNFAWSLLFLLLCHQNQNGTGTVSRHDCWKKKWEKNFPLNHPPFKTAAAQCFVPCVKTSNIGFVVTKNNKHARLSCFLLRQILWHSWWEHSPIEVLTWLSFTTVVIQADNANNHLMIEMSSLCGSTECISNESSMCHKKHVIAWCRQGQEVMSVNFM